jgi:hypothetical protein
MVEEFIHAREVLLLRGPKPDELALEGRPDPGRVLVKRLSVHGSRINGLVMISVFGAPARGKEGLVTLFWGIGRF